MKIKQITGSKLFRGTSSVSKPVPVNTPYMTSLNTTAETGPQTEFNATNTIYAPGPGATDTVANNFTDTIKPASLETVSPLTAQPNYSENYANSDSLETLDQPAISPVQPTLPVQQSRRRGPSMYSSHRKGLLTAAVVALFLVFGGASALVYARHQAAVQQANALKIAEATTVTPAVNSNDSLLTVNGGLKVVGQSNLSTLTVSGNSNLLNGLKLLGNLVASGNGSFNGNLSVAGNETVAGSLQANLISGTFQGTYSGNGQALSNVNAETFNNEPGSFYQNASNLNSGTVSDSLLSNNVPFLGSVNQFSAADSFASTLTVQGTLAGSSGVFGSDVSALSFTQDGHVVCDASNNCNATDTSINGISGSISLQGTAQQVGVTTTGQTLTLSLPQNIDSSSTPTFAGVNTNGAITLANGSTVSDSSSNGLTFVVNGSTFTFPAGGGATQTICTTGVSCAAGGGIAVLLGPSSVQVNNQNTPAIFINNTAGNNLIELQSTGSDKFVVSNSGAVTATSFSGSGANVTNVNALSLQGNAASYFTNAGNISTGTLADGRLSSNVALDNASNNFTGNTNSFVNLDADSILQNGYQVCDFSGNCAGVGGTLTGTGTTNYVPVFTSSGTLGNSIISQGGSTVTVGGTLSADLFQGDGSAINNLNGSNISTGSVGVGVGGTGDTSLTSHGVLYGNGTTAVGVTAAGVTGTCLVATTNGAPSWQSCSAAAAGATPGGSAGGDLSGTYPNPTVSGLKGTPLSINNLSTSNLLIYNGTSWVNASLSGDLTVSSTGVATIGTGAVSNAKLANSSLTVTAGTGLSGGGTIALGSSTSLSVNYGSTTGTAAQGSVTITCPSSGTNLSGGGNTITIGAGGSCGALSVVANPSFNSLTLTTALSIANGGTGATTAAAARTNLSAAASGNNSDITSLNSLTSINNASSLTIGNTSQALQLQGSGTTLSNTANGFTTGVGFATPTSNVTYLFQNAAGGTYNICTTAGNCTGSGGGVTTTGGTTNTLALFSGSQQIGNSLVSQTGSTVTVNGTLAVNTLTPTAALVLGVSSQNVTLQGAGVAISATNGGITNSVNFATPSGSNHNISVPNASGTFAVSASSPLALDANGNLTCANCLTTGTGSGSSAVDSLNTLTGALSLQGTANEIIVTNNNGTGTISLSLPQDINTSSSPTFSSLTLTNGLSVTNAATIGSLSVTGAATAASYNGLDLTANSNGFSVAGGTTVSTLTVSNNVTLNQNLSTSSAPTFAGLTLGTALSIANGGTGATSAAAARSDLGAAASGPNSDITSLGGLTTALATSEGGTGINGASAANGRLLIGNGSGYTLANLAQGSGISITNGSGSITIGVDNTVCTTAGNCGTSNGISGTGTANTIPLFTGTGTLGNSILTQSGTSSVSVAGTLSASALQGNSLSIASGAFTVNTSGAIAAATGIASSGTIDFSSLGSVGVVHTSGNGTLSTGAVVLGTDTSGDYVADLGTLTGLSATATSGVGQVSNLSVTYGAAANTAAQRNTALSFTGSGNLNGTVSGTAGGGFTTSTLTVISNPTFSGLVTAQAGLSVGVANNTAGTILLATTGSGSVTLQSATQTAALTVSVPYDASGTDTICLVTLANCTGNNIGSGSTSYIQNGTSVQAGASFYIQPNAGNVGAAIRANGSGDLLDLLDSSGNKLSSFGANGQLTLGKISTSGSGALGQLSFGDGTTDGFGTTLQTAALAASQTVTVPASSTITDTFCLVNLGNCTGSNGGGGNGNYIFNTATLQSSSNFDISGTGIINGQLKVTGTSLEQANSTTALQVQNSSGQNALSVDTTILRVYINDTLQTANQSAGGTNSNNLSLLSGDATGSGSASGYVRIDTGLSATVAGIIKIGDSNASSILLGHVGTGVTIPSANSLSLGTASSQSGSILFRNTTNGNGLTLQSGATSSNLVFTLPTSDGLSGSCLTTNGSGVLSFGSCTNTPGSSAADVSLDNLSGVALNTSLLPASAGAINLGSTSLPFGDLYLSGSSSTPASNNFRITGSATAARTLTLPDASGVICLSIGNCAGAGGTLQTSYTNSTGGTTPEIKLDATRGALDIQDADTSISGNLLNVRASNSGGLGNLLFDVTSSGKVGINLGTATTPSADLSFGSGADRLINVLTPSTNVAGNALSVQAGSGGAGSLAVAGGSLKLQGGNAAGITGDSNGGNVFIYGGSPINSGTSGNVVLAYDGSNAIGSVGIGTSVPGYRLDVQGGDINTSGNVRTGGTTRLDNSGNLLNIATLTASGNIKGGTLSVGTTLAPYTLSVVNTGTIGFAGVNTYLHTSSANTLEFANASTTATVAITGNQTTTGSANSQLQLNGNGTGGSINIQTYDGNTVAPSISVTGTTGASNSLRIDSASSGFLLLQTVSTANVGINSTAPGAQLEVDANAGTVAQILKANTSSPVDLLQFQNGSASIQSGFNATGQLYYKNGGFISTLAQAALSQSQTITIPASTAPTDTVCLYTLNNCAAAPISGSTYYIRNTTSQQTAANFNIAASSGVAAVIQGASGSDIADFNSSTGTNVARIDSAGDIIAQSGSFNYSGSTQYSTSIASSLVNTNTSSTQITESGVNINLSGNTNNNANNNGFDNINKGIVLNTVTPTTGNYFSGISFGTGYNDLLNYNNTVLLDGSGLLQNAALSPTINYSNLQNVTNLTATGNLTVTGTTTHNGNTYITGANNLGIGTITPTAKLQVTDQTSTKIAAIIQGASGQTADLLELQDSSNNVLAGINATGQLYYKNSGYTSTLVQGALSQSQTITIPATNASGGLDTICLKSLNNCAAAPVSGSTSYIQNGTAQQTAANFNIAATGGVAAVIQGATGSDIADFKNSGGTVVDSLDQYGDLSIAGTTTVTGSSATNYSLNTSNLTNTNTTSTSNTTNAESIGLTGTANGNTGTTNTLNGIKLLNVTTAQNNVFNGVYFGTGYSSLLNYNNTVLLDGSGLLQNAALSPTINYSNLQNVTNLTATGNLTVTGTTTHNGNTYITGANNLGIGTITPTAKLQVTDQTSTKIAAIIQGASGQTADLLEFQDSNSNVLAKVDASGNFTAVAGTFSGLLQTSLGLTASGAAVNLNASSNFATNINTGNSNGTISIGNALSPLSIQGNGATSTTTIFSSNVAADTYPRFTIAANGTISFGSGSTTPDTTLARSAAGVLSLTGSFATSGSLAVGTGNSTTVQLAVLPASKTIIGETIKARLNQSADLLQVQDNNSNVIGGFNAAGQLYYTNSGFTSALVQGTLSQTQSISIPGTNAVGGSDTVCLVLLGNCAGTGTGVTASGGVANYLSKFTAGQTLSVSQLYDNGTFVGIGTTSNSNLNSGQLSITGSATQGALYLQGANNSTAATAVVQAASSQSADIFDVSNSAGNNNYFSVGSAGNAKFNNSNVTFNNSQVAINTTTSSAATLRVAGSATNNVLTLISGTATVGLLSLTNGNGTVFGSTDLNGNQTTNGTNETYNGLATPTGLSSSATGSNFYYKVTAINNQGETAASAEITSGPTNTLSWNIVAGATGYRVYRGTTSGGEAGFYALGGGQGSNSLANADTVSLNGTNAPPTSATGTTLSVQGWNGQTGASAVLQAGASQTGDILDAKSSTGSVLASINASGALTTVAGASVGTTLSVGSNATVGGTLVVTGNTTDNGNTYITGTNNLGVGTITPTAKFQVTDQTPTKIAAIIQGAASQSADLLEFQDSSNNLLSGINASGQFYLETNGFSSTIIPSTGSGTGNGTALAANQTITLPTTNASSHTDTICLLTLNNCAPTATTGATTVGTLDGVTPSSNGAVISGTTLYLQSASAGASGVPGLVNNTTQSFSGAKTFTSPVTVQGSGTSTFSGSVTVNGNTALTTTSTTAFVVQNASSTPLLTADTSGMQVIIGNGSNTVTLTSAGISLSGTARHTKTIVLPAEYAGAVLDSTNDSTCTSANSGTMTSGLDLTNRQNYYSWNATSTTTQCYDVVVQIPVPSDWNSWTTNPLTISDYTTSTTNGAINLEVRDTTGTVESGSNFVSITPGSSSTWTTNTTSTLAGTYTAGGTMTIRLRMSAANSASVRAGTITLKYYTSY